MDRSKIFLKDACPTSIGGQAVMEGVMMRGKDRLAIALRMPDGRIHIKTQAVQSPGRLAKIPVVRGVVALVNSLSIGMKTLLYSADALAYYGDGEAEEEGRLEKRLKNRFGDKTAWNLMLYSSLVLAILFAVLLFIILPTILTHFLERVTDHPLLLNFFEGILRLLIFLFYIILIRRNEEIKTTFRYHGAEHKTIHCFENGKELTPDNAATFYTLHPRCGTSFLMFIMVVSLLVFSLLGWGSVWARILSRILLIPLIAGLSYELLKAAGRTDKRLVQLISLPGLYLQKLTTAEPTKEQLEIAICSLKAVLVPKESPLIEGICDTNAQLIEEVDIEAKRRKEGGAGDEGHESSAQGGEELEV